MADLRQFGNIDCEQSAELPSMLKKIKLDTT